MEEKDGLVTKSKKIVNIYIVFMFALVWLCYYNRFVFGMNRTAGGAVSVFIYFIIYNYFAKLYRAYKIGTYKITEIIFSQILAIGLADTVLYVECCLVHRGYVSILPGLMTAGIQLLGMIVWAVYTKQYFIRYIEANKTLVIYGRTDAGEFVRKLNQKYEHLFQIKETVGILDCPAEQIHKKIDGYDTVILYEVEKGRRTGTMEYCIEHCKNLYITPRVSDIILQGFEERTLIDTPLLKYEYHYLDERQYKSKRLLDLIVSVIALALAAVPMLFTAAAIKIEDRGPVFFRQKRCTAGGKVFEIIKFRSMTPDAEKGGRVIPCTERDPRITRVGNVIRRFRIDELPQLFNIIKGEMSVVGPRPERVEHVEKYCVEVPEFAYRMRVKGGLTGYAQIFGKYNTSAYDKLKLDLLYIENQSLLLDLKLIMLTVKTLFIAESTEGFEKEKSKLIGNWDAEG
ncbi:MAG: exopolysaccharide biosynthesis polyprenyl glycosylphosphotransferase [Blautia sp.]|nr:exopolysaccharide biosynthesis polyprenyl glycosylphosphotransferase [Blautia sp.]MCM1202170.1 exopolysaccharide biosynthesis polyprenyl glycosylphosphotransferase [Bacteroides fragilis]